ncbi:DNA-deoxyinosine glycosylase [Betaproteobacteria bacterium]|nr:DNA-deoxyinosine glycosylase [Betaproteobacteria bacterium]
MFTSIPSYLNPMLIGLPPIFNPQIRLLILGSFPSPASLAARQYYGHKQNHFWKLLGAIFDEPLYERPYAERVARALEHRIGIWDVYQSCTRQGALDADIRAGAANDFATLLQQTPNLRRVCFNGQTAGKFAPRLAALGLETRILPSSSPAYTLPFAQKLERWKAGVNP